MSGFADAVVVAAGKGTRMAGLDKLAEMLAGRPVLYWALAAMRNAPSVRRIVLVTPADAVSRLSETDWVRDAGALVTAGGARRRDSVAAGIALADAEVVLVHDGARPFVLPEVVEAVASAARRDGAALPVVAVTDALKRRTADGHATAVDRGGLYRAQTPQGARRGLLLHAFERAARDVEYGDEASLLESVGVSVTMVPGDPANIKVTERADLQLVRALADGRAGGRADAPRHGLASDGHPFGPADGLRLGGLEIADAPRLFGHSDGDVVLHALADAILGAAAGPDIGRLFPASDATTAGIDSRRLLAHVVQRVSTAGWVPSSVDVSVLAARPRLGAARLDAMRDAIAGLCGVAPSAVSVKASTGNLSGPEGAGRAISATALVTLVRQPG